MNSTLAALSEWKERAPMPLPRGGCTTGVIDGQLFVANGTYWSEGTKYWSERADVFDPVSDRWEAAPAFPTIRADAAYLTWDNGVYAFGGGDHGGTDTDAWRFVGGTWIRIEAMRLPAPRRSMQIAAYGGKIFLFGGYATAQPSSITPTAWVAHPGQSWKACAPIPGPVRISPAVAAVPEGIILAGGATPENSQPRNLDEILLYRPASDKWSVIGHLPAPLRAGFGLSYGKGMLLLGGYTDQFVDQVLRIDPITGLAAIIGKLPHVLCDSRFVVIGNRLIGVSGEAGDKIRGPWTFETELERPA